jgi:ribosomal protein L5
MHTKDLQTCVSTRSSEIYRQFELITEQKPETPAEASARKAIKPFLVRALRDIGRIETVLEQIRLKYPSC